MGMAFLTFITTFLIVRTFAVILLSGLVQEEAREPLVHLQNLSSQSWNNEVTKHWQNKVFITTSIDTWYDSQARRFYDMVCIEDVRLSGYEFFHLNRETFVGVSQSQLSFWKTNTNLLHLIAAHWCHRRLHHVYSWFRWEISIRKLLWMSIRFGVEFNWMKFKLLYIHMARSWSLLMFFSDLIWKKAHQ